MKEFKEGYLKENSVVIFPTDTVYGMGCLINDEVATNKIYEIKGREQTKELAVLCSNLKQVEEIAVLSNKANKLAKAFWPGPLTIVLKTTEKYFKETNKKTIGIRIPNHQVALMLINNNGPLKTTSVNKSHQPPLNDIKKIKEEFSHLVDYIYEEQNNNYLNVSSTTINLSNDKLEFLRIGSIKEEEILEVYND